MRALVHLVVWLVTVKLVLSALQIRKNSAYYSFDSRTSSASYGMPLSVIGSVVSVLKKSGVRYEGTVSSVDAPNRSLVLVKGTAFLFRPYWHCFYPLALLVVIGFACILWHCLNA